MYLISYNHKERLLSPKIVALVALLALGLQVSLVSADSVVAINRLLINLHHVLQDETTIGSNSCRDHYSCSQVSGTTLIG